MDPCEHQQSGIQCRNPLTCTAQPGHGAVFSSRWQWAGAVAPPTPGRCHLAIIHPSPFILRHQQTSNTLRASLLPWRYDSPPLVLPSPLASQGSGNRHPHPPPSLLHAIALLPPPHPDVSRCGGHRVDQAGIPIHPNLPLHTKEPLVPFTGLAHLRISLPLFILMSFYKIAARQDGGGVGTVVLGKVNPGKAAADGAGVNQGVFHGAVGQGPPVLHQVNP